MSTCVLTSGTTGARKSIIHSMDAHLTGARMICEALKFCPGDSWLLNLPVHHVSGLSILIRGAVSGGSVVFRQKETPILQQIKSDGISHVSVVPTQLQRMLEDSSATSTLKKLKAILIGGASIPNLLWRRCVAFSLPVYGSYGMTETASMIAVDDFRDPTANYYRPLPGINIRLDEKGIIQIKSPTLGKVRLEDGYFPTGDVGKWDRQGRLQVLGRKDDVIISGGVNIHPLEIERALLESSRIERAVVFGVPDDRYGRRPVACIYPGPEFPMVGLEKLPRYKHPDRYFSYPPEFLRSMKINRKNLEALYRANALKRIG